MRTPRGSDEPFTMASRTPTPEIAITKPDTIRVRCAPPLREPLGRQRREQQPRGGGREDDAGLDRVVAHARPAGTPRPRTTSPSSISHCTFWVIRPEVRDRHAEQARRQQRLLAGPLLGTHRPEEPEQHQPAGDQQREHQRSRCCRPPGCPSRRGRGRRPTAPRPRCRRASSDRPAADPRCGRLSSTITTMISAWKTKAARQLIAEVMRPPISGPAAAPTPPIALIAPNALAREG